MSWRNRLRAILAGYVALAVLLGGCARTVAPRTVTVSQASWDGTNQNSGFVGWSADGRGIITSHARDRYNALVRAYGARIAGSGLQPDDGLTATSTNTWLIDQEHLADFMDMNRWRRDGQR